MFLGVVTYLVSLGKEMVTISLGWAVVQDSMGGLRGPVTVSTWEGSMGGRGVQSL